MGSPAIEVICIPLTHSTGEFGSEQEREMMEGEGAGSGADPIKGALSDVIVTVRLISFKQDLSQIRCQMIIMLIYLLYTQARGGTPWKMSFFVLHIYLTKIIQMTSFGVFFN